MNLKRFGVPAVVAVTAALALSSCAANEGGGSATPEETTSSLSGTIDAAGASSQGSAQEAWVAAFQTANPDVTINYDPSGSGAGRESFQAGAFPFAGSDRAFTIEEIEAGPFDACVDGSGIIELPTYISPIAIIFNVEGVDSLNLDAATAAGLFAGTITNWNDPAIAALNEGATLPDANITAVHRSDDSGTTKNFADYLNKTAGDVWAEEPSDTFPYQTGEGAQGTSGVVEAVTNGVNTIGYADASRAGDLGVAKIKVGDEFVGYTPEAAAAVDAESPLVEGREANDLAIALDRTTTDPTHYPLVLVSYAIVCQEYADAAQGELVKAYVSYLASEEGQTLAAEQAGSAPLSTELSEQVSAALETVK